MKRGLVISGGGALGAFGAGTLAALNKNYDVVAGVSTGALLAPLAALSEHERIREAYTSVTQADIFDVNPFTKSGKISIPNAIWRIARGKTTLGESNNLLKTINRFLRDDDFARLKSAGKLVVVAAQCLSLEPYRIHYFHSLTETPERFKKAMWASANAPLACSITNIDGRQYTDAGVAELLSLAYLVRMGCTDIDVIIHRPRTEEKVKSPLENLFHNGRRLWDIIRGEVERNDLENGLILAENAGVNVSVCWLPRKLTDNSLLFDKATMSGWYDEGFDSAFAPSRWDEYEFAKTLEYGRV